MMFGGSLNQDYLKHLNDLINGMGLLTKIWTITYQSFKEQKMTDDEAVMHTQALMSTMMRTFMKEEE